MPSLGNGEKPVHAYLPGSEKPKLSDDCSRVSPLCRGALFFSNQQLSVATDPTGRFPVQGIYYSRHISYKIPNLMVFVKLKMGAPTTPRPRKSVVYLVLEICEV
jgi:hypothetical protein